MHDPNAPTMQAARAEAQKVDLTTLDISQATRFKTGAHFALFERLRAEDPVHLCKDSPFGPYWSITKYADIMKVDTNHRVFSSQRNIVIGDLPAGDKSSSFIRKDEPEHGIQRKAVSPAVGPDQLVRLEQLIRERTIDVLSNLPRDETFDWVELVSMELTTRMLATLFDFPFEDRHLLPYWTNVVASDPRVGNTSMSVENRAAELEKCRLYFENLWKNRQDDGEKLDFISLLANNPNTSEMVNNPGDFLGNLILLIVGGNDTTRNSMTASLLALKQNPAEDAKLRADPSLIPNMVAETIRWQTPLGHMRRTALADIELNGKQIRKGDKIVMWYISGNRDAEKFENPDAFLVDRKNARNHIAFGFGIHRCMGNRVAELQLRVLWEEILNRDLQIEIMGAPERTDSNFIMGYESLLVRIAS